MSVVPQIVVAGVILVHPIAKCQFLFNKVLQILRILFTYHSVHF